MSTAMTHDAFVQRARKLFPATIVREPSYEEWSSFVRGYLAKQFGVGTKTQQYEKSIEFLGQVAQKRTGSAREHALRLQRELHDTLTQHRRKKQ